MCSSLHRFLKYLMFLNGKEISTYSNCSLLQCVFVNFKPPTSKLQGTLNNTVYVGQTITNYV